MRKGMITPQATLAICLLSMFVIVGIWDVTATAMLHPEATVSNILGTWSNRFPILPLAIGVLMGHLFWPRMPVQP